MCIRDRLSTNMPCNASEATSMFQRRRIGLPDFQITMAMIHNEPAAHPYSAQVLRDCIEFVEKEYGVEYDWNAPVSYTHLDVYKRQG